MHTPAAPQAIQRTPFDRWLWERHVLNAEAGEALGVTGETVRRYRLPFGDQGRRIPDEELLEKIFAWTSGAITPADFYPPHLGRPAPTEGAAA